ncbi:hypothetical protein GDO81_025994 [Engystomops pustulosus]|uniref:G-protein coupled receptors family 1 profile domain-containing protein n=1 Tax=Engystomops pustulosus TaxID=76066 RepID=A0AAV6ZLL6_ENGPU|nr:hypothetical protein GDO81_025994 [Engystomops pustulosus]
MNDSDNNCTSRRYNSTIQVYTLVVHVMVCVLGVTGNGLVIWFCSSKMEKTVNTMWILNLAIADFLFTFFLSLRITYLALGNQWPFGPFMCNLFWFLNNLNTGISVFQLMVISIDRCVCVYFPVWCKNHRTIRLAKITVLLIWIISFVFNIPYFFFQSTCNDRGKLYCGLSHDKTFKWKVVVRLIVLIVIFTIIVLCYAAIAVQVKRKHINLSSRPFKVFVAIIISFFICFFPYNIFLLLQIFEHQIVLEDIRTIKEIMRCLMTANSCINPILYIFIGQGFKERFCTSIHTVLRKAFTENVENI